MFYAIVSWHGLGEFKDETFNQTVKGVTCDDASFNAKVWARSHLDKAVQFDVLVIRKPMKV